jgi:mono/diheme cytochrome c family protein
MILAGVAFISSFLTVATASVILTDREVMGDASSVQTPPLSAITTLAEQGQAIFDQKCMSCHSIGGGRLVGPDLKGVTERRDRDWIIQTIVFPEQLIAQEDPITDQLIEEYGIPMPNMGLSEPEAEEVLAYIEAQSRGGQSSSSPGEDAAESTPVSAGNATIGWDIFIGKTSLQNGGAACISCHNVSGTGSFGGGTVGKDLTEAYATFGQSGIASILKTAPFPIMKEIYTAKPLTGDEIAHLMAFLQEVGIKGQPKPAQNRLVFILVSVVGFLVIIGIFQLIWRRRLSGVRQPMVKGGSE